ncbi:hypothetical protein [Sulfuricurvum sp.]|uniref:hypothetical protein n=1 Tax=Sulfuricurvum sp. TaxID=2025608 RepID=UPI002D757395|nr:hypothetical protein [Sulfuricurvum sp.]HZF69875.1 hypothetical protein [Sulfuricurvum sp.]
MFDSITFFKQDTFDSSSFLDIGSLVESMLFYGETSIIADHNILRELFSYFKVDHIIELIEEGLLNVIYSESQDGIATQSIHHLEHHNIISITTEEHTLHSILQKICVDIIGKTGKGRRTANRIEKLIKIKQHDKKIWDEALNAYANQEYINQSAKNIIQSLIPQKIDLDNFTFQTEKTPSGIIIDTNINFNTLNNIYHQYVPVTHSSISPALILGYILNVETGLHISSKNNSEIATSRLSTSIISNKINSILNTNIESSKKISAFQDFIFSDAKLLREAINNKLIDLDELIIVLKKSRKFKEWLIGLEPNQDLIKSYYSEVTKKTFIDKLPGKSVRWALFTGTGLLADAMLTGGFGTAVGIGTGAVDALFLDKLISGWKPNQFIEDDVKRLLQNHS